MKPIDLRQLLKKIHALLNIEWLYEPEPRSAGLRSPGPFASAAPAIDDIDELIGLGEIGHVRRIHEKLARDRAAARRNAAISSARCAAIVNTFDFRRYAAGAGGNS